MTEKKFKPPVFVIFTIAGLLLIGTMMFISIDPVVPAEQSAELAEPETAQINESETDSYSIDIDAALSERILGDPSAPVKISEHSSLTCGHCGAFHKNTFGQLKEQFIDSGKAYLVLSDFPLNGPALHASMIARCLPHDKYFDFIEMLFKEQEKWAYDNGYINFLKSKALKQGLSNEEFKICIRSEELQKGILARMSASKAQWEIASTPSFVINNKQTIIGVQPIEAFAKIINDELEKLEEPRPKERGLKFVPSPLGERVRVRGLGLPQAARN